MTLLVIKSLLLITEVRRGFNVQIFCVVVFVSLYITNLRFCPHSVFVLYVDLRANSTYLRIQHESNGLIAETECVYCEVRNESLTKLVNFSL